MFALGFLTFAAAEIGSFVVVAGQIGVGWALLILVAVSALGPLVVRRVGIGVLVRTQDRLAAGDVPTREVLDSLLVLIGGFLISLPGFVGDALGLLLMIGPVRQLVIRTAGRRLAGRVRTFQTDRWRVIDARSRPVPTSSGPPEDRSTD